MRTKYGKDRYAISTWHGEVATVYTICLLYGPDNAGHEPLASVRAGQWIGPPENRCRVVGTDGGGGLIVDSSRWGMGQTLFPATVLSLLEEVKC